MVKLHLAQEILDIIYPVGSIYMSVNSTNPKNLFGGTWVAWGTGRVPVGIDTSQTEFASVEKTGGEKTHKLTVKEMPSHRHSLAGYRDTSANATATDKRPRMYAQGSGASWDGGDSIGLTGDSQAHNNLQPYQVVAYWKRTA